jgi:hypothetical protein
MRYLFPLKESEARSSTHKFPGGTLNSLGTFEHPQAWHPFHPTGDRPPGEKPWGAFRGIRPQPIVRRGLLCSMSL